ncbi:NACHT domain-containing protein, partial [Streptomyces milbemycinicus]|uniref:NACHT domain-containing protein n=1 Tax=Streptomyces milbemycinicus TaxID=476552 RepID=UPI00117E9593
PDPGVSPWEAMSGAAVWSEGHLIGVVIEHHASEGLGRLTASRVDRWHEALSEAEAAQLALFTGFPARREGLREVRVPAGRAGQREEAIRALLSAERTDSDVQPYRFLDADAPALERVYVHQRVVEHTEAAAPEPVPAEEILDRHRHVLIEGEAGAGKSTFTQRVARRGAETPGAREHAVRIPAVDLTHGAPLPALLRTSVMRRLGGHLSAELPRDLFESSGASWLLLVDGLDEIVDTAARRRVISIVEANARASGPYRWLVTTRFLPPHELAPLRDAGLASYALAPFDESQLRELAHRWLDGYGERAEAFLLEVERSGLRQLVRTPLVAAITLSIFRRAPEAGLPTGRPGLYQECVRYLFSGRPGEEERRAGLLRAVAQAGGSRRLAEWLYGARVPLLTALAHNTLTTDAPLLEEALRWIAQQADEPTDFLHGWREVVTGLLSGAGLLLNEKGSGELHWAHRSFAEYLAAHDTASRLPADWPGAEPLRDELVRDALRGERRDFGVLAIACWARRAGADAEALVGWLLRSSDDYDLFGKYRGTSIVVLDGDSSVPDDHAALAGRLLAEGVRVPDALTTSVLNRLLERAGSPWHAQEFCALIAAQPMRGAAYQAVVTMADNDRLSITVRSGAVVALGRIFGFEAALAKAERLLASRQIEHTTYASPNSGRTWSGPVSEGRIAAAYYLLALGSRIHGPVRRVLTDVSLPADDDLGRFLLGNCAVALGDTVSLLRLLDLAPDGDRLPNKDDMRLLIQAGAYDTADSMTNALFAMVEDLPPPDSPLWRGEWEYWLGDIVQALCAAAEAYLSAGRDEAAAAVARRILGAPLPSDEMNATPYTVLVRTGVPEPALAALAPGKDGTSPPLYGPHWTEIARTLHGEGYVDEVRNATEARLAHPMPLAEAVDIAKYLVEAGDPRGLEALLAIANHPDTEVSIALRAVQDLLGGEFHAAAVDTLIALSRRPVSGGTGLEIARLLAGAGVEDETSRLALTLVRACMGDPDTWEMAALTEPLRLLSALRPEEGRALLLEAAASPHLPTRDLADLARMLERCGERGALEDLLRRWSAVATHDHEFTQLGSFLARCGKKGEAAAAYRKALAVRAGDTEIWSLYGVKEAVDGLRSLGSPLTPEDISALRTAYASLAPPDNFSNRHDVEWLAALLDQLTEGEDEE